MERDLELSRQVCFALYSASRAVTTLYRPALERLDLTYPQYLVMLVLWEHGERTVKQLGADLMLDSGTLSPLLKRMESAGVLHRERSPRDERSVVVQLTPQGERLREQAARVPAMVASASALPPSELTDLRERLTALTATITAASRSATAGPEDKASPSPT
jgi:DNA-binding MarR family transcriptional regulator